MLSRNSGRTYRQALRCSTRASHSIVEHGLAFGQTHRFGGGLTGVGAMGALFDVTTLREETSMSINWRKWFAVGGFVGSLCLSGSAPGQTVTLKMAHQWPQNEADYVIATGVRFAQEVEKRSNGQMKVQFFPAESLVKASATHTALRNGTVDLSIYPYIYLVGAIPEMNLMAMPGLWKNHDEAFRYHTSAVWKKLEEKLEAYGIKTLCWIQVGVGVASAKKFIRGPADLPGQKTRMSGKYSEYTFQKAGAS